jgi:pyruvate dehydrogenase E2 component (dihydrolipoamide acetyltransferase)
MAITIIMPQGGQDIEVGEVVRWLKAEGDPVVKGEVICEVETEKAIFELEAPGDGFLRKIVVPEGIETPIFSVIGVIGALDEEIPFDELLLETSPEIPQAKLSVPVGPRIEGTEPQTQEKIKISPRAKRLANERGIPIHLLKGSGSKGRIIEQDVRDFIESQILEQDESRREQVEGGRVISMSRTRKVTARRMQKSKQTAPHFYVTVAIDMTRCLEFQAEFNQEDDNPETDTISITDLITRACVLALQEYPALNSSVLSENEIVLWEDLHIGIAVALDEGLVVPILEHADQLTLNQIAQQRRYIVEKAREGKQATLATGRFTISNLGMFNVDNFVAIINPPETAILAVSSIEKKPVAIDGDEIGLRDMMNITLSIDHRVTDGVTAARFVNSVKSLLEEPEGFK